MVFDTNVLVSLYVFADSRFLPLRHQVDDGRWVALSNAACLEEFRRVLAYSQFGVDPVQQQQALAAYRSKLSLIEPAADPKAMLPHCSDRDDQKFLELARDGDAQVLITADKALLKLARRDRLRGLFRIITPTAMLDEFQAFPLAP